MVSNPPEPVRIFMSLYQQISEILPVSRERAARLLHQCRPLLDVLPLRRRAVSIDNNSDFVTNASQFRLFAHLYFEVRTGFRCGFHFFLKFRAARVRCAQNFSRRFTLLLVLSALLAQLQDDGFHTSDPSRFDGSFWFSLRLWVLRLRSRLLCLSRCLLNGACQLWPALWLLYLIFFNGNS